MLELMMIYYYSIFDYILENLTKNTEITAEMKNKYEPKGEMNSIYDLNIFHKLFQM